jgi:NTP pyrophosphatase (non-canonical NTP hydrolase)
MTYTQFVNSVTSEQSKNYEALIESLGETNESVNISRLLTGAIGQSSEAGEYLDIVKKIVFQGKEFDATTKNKLISELGDCIFYFTQSLIALDVSLEEVIQANVNKLSERYPNGFDFQISESRYKI